MQACDHSFNIQLKIKVPFEFLDFNYGRISFKHSIEKINKEIEFDIENLEIRPEFEVLRSYFSKALRLKKAEVEIQAEFEDGNLISQLATSKDIQRINSGVIEGIKFKFITNNLLKKKSPSNIK